MRLHLTGEWFAKAAPAEDTQEVAAGLPDREEDAASARGASGDPQESSDVKGMTQAGRLPRPRRAGAAEPTGTPGRRGKRP